jgi:primosomal protein N' (replication factor Y)
MGQVARVLIMRNVDRLYDYIVPEALSMVAGSYVQVPIGPTTVEGLVMHVRASEIQPVAPEGTVENPSRKLREITGLLDKKTLAPDIVTLILWLSETYICSPYIAYQTVVGTRKYRDSPDEAMSAIAEGHVLTEAQESVLASIRAKQGYHTWLLHGVTASGKTEIYLQLAADIMAAGKQVLFLVPEIGLTPQLRTRVEERFGKRGVVMHSGQTPKQRDLAWSKALSGQAAIVVGPRSAVFAPVPALGAIILDEEHDGSYKQDSNPRYWTHDVASFRCRYSHAPLILGSATPRLETRYHAQIGQATCVSMPYRANRNPMPPIVCVDTKEDPNTRVGGIFSQPLDAAIRLRLAKGEKTIILLNRRGYAPYVGCQSCQTIYACSQCGLSMTYHRDRVFRCHRCYVTAPATLHCPTCKKPRLGYMGLGIQKVEAELIKHFPDSRIMRADRDSATTAKQLEKILGDFDREGDILIGTQLVAKGHHFESVTLVGVLGIDTALNLQDFRAPERVYQLLVQVAGRAGRGAVPGEVMVQTSMPQHYALDSAVRQDDTGFYEQELAYREELLYPPFCRLLNLVYSGPDMRMVSQTAEKDADYLMPLVAEGLTLFPAISCPVDKLQNRYRWHILIKFSAAQETLLRMQLAGLPAVHRNLRRIIDMDPVSLL